MKKALGERADIELLIDRFYEKVLQSPELSYYFVHAIPNWDFHKERFIKYWTSQILFSDEYPETPLHQHVAVDERYQRSFTKHHFDLWAQLWVNTVDELFVGERAELAKESGANMAKNIYLKMYINRV